MDKPFLAKSVNVEWRTWMMCKSIETLRPDAEYELWFRRQVQIGADAADAGELIPAEEVRSEEHTSELQSLRQLLCRLLLEKKELPVIGECGTGSLSPSRSGWPRMLWR